jgi:predicted TIM-barrel fold metal-dependent hydrolase
VVEPFEAGRPLGIPDTFGLTQQRGEQKRTIKEAGAARAQETHTIRPEVNWDVQARLEDMDRADTDVAVLFPTYVSSYCAFRDGGFENAMYRAYHSWVSAFCAQGKGRLRWSLVANMSDVAAGVAEIRHWGERDSNLVGIYLSPRGPGGVLLDSPDLYPIYEVAQALDLTILVHPGTARPPYGPGTSDLGGAWFLTQSLCNSWSGMVATGALIGGGILDLYPRLRAAVVETSGGWMPLAMERFDANFLTSPQHVPKLERLPRDVLAEGRYGHAVDTWEGTLDYLVQALGEDVWLFSTDFPHKGTQWPNGVAQIVNRSGMSDQAKRKMLGENALRVIPRLRN